MRRPAVAGSFYPARKDALERELDRCLPEGRPGSARRLRALVAPHAGYAYSGAVAGRAYAALREDGLPEGLVVVGPRHAGGSLLTTSAQAWSTPLGEMAVDRELHDALVAAGPIVDDERAHAREHSVEVQVPFLQRLGAPRFVPVLMGLQDEETAAQLARAVATAAEATGRDIVMIASSDLAHVGPSYMTDPAPGETVDAAVRRLDAAFVRAALTLDAGALLDAVRRKGVPSCGHGPVAAAMAFARGRGATSARLLAQATSHDVAPHDSCVGYAALAFEGNSSQGPPPRR